MRRSLVRETSYRIQVGFKPALLDSAEHDYVMTMLAAGALSTLQSTTVGSWLVLNTRDLGRTMLAIETRHTTCKNGKVRLLVPKATFSVETLLDNELLFRLRITRTAT